MATRTSIFATNDNVSADDLNSLAGAWNSYTPTLGGFTAGNGVATGAYQQFGKLVRFRAKFVFGSTSAAASAVPTLTLPVTAHASAVTMPLTGFYLDASSAYYLAPGLIYSTTVAQILQIGGATGLLQAPSTTAPFTWTTSDAIIVSGTYEAA